MNINNIDEKYPSGADILREREFKRKKREQEAKEQEDRMNDTEVNEQEFVSVPCDEYFPLPDNLLDDDLNELIIEKLPIIMESNLKLPYKNAFREYALGQITKGSFESYLQYLRSLDHYFFKPLASESQLSPFEMLKPKNLLNHTLQEVIDSFYEWKAALDSEINEPQFVKVKQSYMQKWMSAYSMYISFIEDYFEINEEYDESELPKGTSPTEGTEVISQANLEPEIKEVLRARKRIYINTIKKSFKGRLRSQDRMSMDRHANLPINFISQVIQASDLDEKEKGFINKWTENLYKKISVWALKGDKRVLIPLSIIKYIRLFNNQGARIKLNDSDVELLMLTQVEPDKYEPMCVARENNIHIDHEPSLDTILGENPEKWPALTSVSDIIKRVAAVYKLDATDVHDKQLAKYIKEDPQASSEIIELWPEIKKEFNMLSDQYETLHLMYGAYNIAKG